MELLLTDDDIQPENHCNRYTINSNLVLKQEAKEEEQITKPSTRKQRTRLNEIRKKH